MATYDFIRGLHCPYCGGKLDFDNNIVGSHVDVEYGVVCCDCSRYPILDGVIVLRSVPSDLLKLLDQGEFTEALWAAIHALEPQNTRTWRRRAVDYLTAWQRPLAAKFETRQTRRVGMLLNDGRASFRDVVSRLRSKPFADYLYARHANPSFLSAVALIAALRDMGDSVVPGRPAAHVPQVLDFSCGTAHTSFLISQLYPELGIVACDHDFTNLLIAKRFNVPLASFVCTDGEAPLPFGEKIFSAVFCLDAFHYIHSKAALAREMKRVVRPDGVVLLPHLHNACAVNPTPGIPCNAEGYIRCFESAGARLFPEFRLIEQLCIESRVDLRSGPTDFELSEANAFCLVAGQQELLRRCYETGDLLIRSRESLTPNPIYRIDRAASHARLTMDWPNGALEAECRQVKGLIPEEVTLDGALLDRILACATTPEDDADLRALTQAFVLVHLPPCYGSTLQPIN